MTCLRRLPSGGFVILSIAIVLSACAVPDVEETRKGTIPTQPATGVTAVQAGEVILMIGDHDRIACLQEFLTDRNEKLSFIAENKVRDALYPWFETNSPTPKYLAGILEKKRVRERLAELSVRYIVTVSGSLKKRQDVKGGILCSHAGCLGFEVWDRTSRISVSVFDVKHRTDVGSFGTKASGKSSMPAIILPIPLISPTETTACVTLAKRLARYFAGQGETSLPTNDSTGATDSRNK